MLSLVIYYHYLIYLIWVLWLPVTIFWGIYRIFKSLKAISLIIDFSWIRFFRFRTCHLALLPRRVKSDTWCGPPLRQGLMIASLAPVFLPLTCGAPDQMRFLCLCSPRVRWSGVAPPLELNRMCCRHFPETSPTFSSSSPGHSSILISFLTLPPSLPSLAFPHSCSWSVPFPDLLMWSQSGQDTRRRGFKVQVFLFVHFYFFFLGRLFCFMAQIDTYYPSPSLLLLPLWHTYTC